MASEGIRGEVEAFFSAYSAAFWRNDSAAIATHFAYPCHVVSDAETVSQLPIANQDECRKAVERVLGWHREIGATASRPSEIIVTQLSPRLVSVSLKSDFLDRRGQRLYDFQGIYTLIRVSNAWKIAAISHNQIPRLLECLARIKPA